MNQKIALTSKQLEILILLAIFLFSFILTVGFIESNNLGCVSEKIMGVKIGTCGITRGMISISHGDLLDAFAYNPLSFYFYFLFLAILIADLAKWDSEYLRKFVYVGGYLIVLYTIVLLLDQFVF